MSALEKVKRVFEFNRRVRDVLKGRTSPIGWHPLFSFSYY